MVEKVFEVGLVEVLSCKELEGVLKRTNRN
jgi:hypothetical protein